MSKITITINLNLQQIKEDVWNKTYVTGLRRNTGDNPEQVSLIQAGDEPESERQIYRSIDNAFNSLKAVLGEYLSVISSNLIVINYPAAIPETLTVTLNMPANFNPAVEESLSSSMHSYIVSNAVAAWFALTNPEESDVYLKASAALAERISIMLMERIRPSKPEQKPVPEP